MQRGPKRATAPESAVSGLSRPVANEAAGASGRRALRLRTKSHLEYVKQRGKSRAGRLCVVSAAEPLDQSPRFAIITSRRYSLKAVRRNRARRLLREAYRTLRPELQTTWIVLIPRRRMQEAKMGEVLAEVTELCQQLGLLRRP